VEVTYKSWYPAVLGHISVSMIVLVVEVSSAIVLMFCKRRRIACGAESSMCLELDIRKTRISKVLLAGKTE
jgi:hypothetical protein